MRVFVTGGTGLIGCALVRRLLARGDSPVVLSRRADRARLDPASRGIDFVQGDPAVAGGWEAALGGCDAVVNLVGHNLFANRWDDDIKRTIRDSRVVATDNLVAAIARAGSPVKVLVQGSAIGYYGPRGDDDLTESSPAGADFMASVCREWESAARPAEALGLRVAVIRTGVVLARNAGALRVMTPAFRFGPGVPVGSGGGFVAKGRQWLSWIHLEDIVGILLLALDHPEARGPINGTSPRPVRNADFARALSKALWRPYAPWRFFIPVGPPDFLLQLALGEVAHIVTTGQKVLPSRVQDLGYSWRFAELDVALADIFPRAHRERAHAQDPAAAGTG